MRRTGLLGVFFQRARLFKYAFSVENTVVQSHQPKVLKLEAYLLTVRSCWPVMMAKLLLTVLRLART